MVHTPYTRTYTLKSYRELCRGIDYKMTVDHIMRFEHLAAVIKKIGVLLYRTYGPSGCLGTDSNQGLPTHKSETSSLSRLSQRGVVSNKTGNVRIT